MALFEDWTVRTWQRIRILASASVFHVFCSDLASLSLLLTPRRSGCESFRFGSGPATWARARAFPLIPIARRPTTTTTFSTPTTTINTSATDACAYPTRLSPKL
eukprot:1109247-Rhodomonas_salina.2